MNNNSSVFTFGERTAVITGGSKNIGLAIAEKFSAAGLSVAIISKNENALSSAAHNLAQRGHTVSTWPCDILKIDCIAPTLAKI